MSNKNIQLLTLQFQILALETIAAANSGGWKEGENDPDWVKRDKSGRFSTTKQSSDSSQKSSSTDNTSNIKQPFTAELAEKFDKLSSDAQAAIKEMMFGKEKQQQLNIVGNSLSQQNKDAGRFFAEKVKEVQALSKKSFREIQKKQAEIAKSVSKFAKEHRTEIKAFEVGLLLGTAVVTIPFGLASVSAALGPVTILFPEEIAAGVATGSAEYLASAEFLEFMAAARTTEIAFRAVSLLKGVGETALGIYMYVKALNMSSEIYAQASATQESTLLNDVQNGLLDAGKTILTRVRDNSKMRTVTDSDLPPLLGIPADVLSKVDAAKLKEFKDGYNELLNKIYDGDLNDPEKFIANLKQTKSLRDRVLALSNSIYKNAKS